MKKMIIMLIMVLTLVSVTGCSNWVAEEPQAEEEIVIEDEFEAVYVQKVAGINRFIIYRHLPTDQMYICYVTYSMVPMGITYDEYMEKAGAFHGWDVQQEEKGAEGYDERDEERY